MRINPNIFKDGFFYLGADFPLSAKFHPLWAEDEGYHFVAASFYQTGEVRLFQVNEHDSGEKIELIHERTYKAGIYSQCRCLDWSPDGHYIVAGYEDESIKIFDCYTDKMVNSFFHKKTSNNHGVESVCFSPDGRFIASGLYCGKTIALWEASSGKKIKEFNHNSVTSTVMFSPDNRYIVSSGETIKMWDIVTYREVNDFGYDTSNSVRFSPDNSFIISCSEDNTIKLYDATTGKEVKGFHGKGHTNHVNSVSFSPDGKFVVSGSEDKTVKFWDATTGQEIWDFKLCEYYEAISSANFSSDGRLIICSSRFRGIIVLDAITGKERGNFGKTDGRSLGECDFAPNGKFIVSSGYYSGIIKLWNTSDGKRNIDFCGKGHMADVRCVSFSPDGKFVVSGSEDKILKLWNAITGDEENNFNGQGHSRTVNSVSFSSDSRFIVSAAQDHCVKLWNVNTGKEIFEFNGSSHTDWVRSASFSPNDKFIVSCSEDNTIKLWDVTTGKEINNLRHKDKVQSTNFSPDGKLLASYSYGSTIKLWNMITGQEINSFKGDDNCVFNPTGKSIAWCDLGNKLIFCDVISGKKISSVNMQKCGGRIKFSPDGRFLVQYGIMASIINLEQILGESWLKDHLNSPLILTGVWFPDESLQYMKETKQGNIVDNRPIARCGECGLFFPVEDKMLGKELRCPNETGRGKCNRLVKLNEFTAGVER